MNKVDTTGKYGAAGVMLLLLFNLQSQVGQMRSDMNLVMAAVGVDRMRQVSDNQSHGYRHTQPGGQLADESQTGTELQTREAQSRRGGLASVLVAESRQGSRAGHQSGGGG